MSSVLEAPPPRFSAGDVARIAAQLFGLDVAVVDLGSERDQTFLAQGAAGSGVVKISNSEEKAAFDKSVAAVRELIEVVNNLRS